MPTNEQVTTIVERYAEAVGKAEREAIVACFAEDAEVVDPYPSPAVNGHDGIRGFWDRVLGMGTPQSFDVEHLSVTGDRAAFLFSIALDVGGSALGVRGIDVVRVDDSGLIAELTAYWDPASMTPL